MKTSALPIETPCTVDWQSMTPADKGRFCGQCKKVVHDLSRMSEKEARTLLQTNARSELCVRYVHDAQGHVFFAGDRLVPATLLHRARRTAVAAAALAAAACSSPMDASSGGTSAGGHGDDSAITLDPDYQEVMGAAPPWNDDAGEPDAADGGAVGDAGRADGGDAGGWDGGADAAADGSADADAGADAGPDAETSPF